MSEIHRAYTAGLARRVLGQLEDKGLESHCLPTASAPRQPDLGGRVGIQLYIPTLTANPCRHGSGVLFLKNNRFGLSEGRDSKLLLNIAVATINGFGVSDDFPRTTFGAFASAFHRCQFRNRLSIERSLICSKTICFRQPRYTTGFV